VQGSGAELRCAELLVMAGIQLKLDCIPVPDLIIRTETGRALIEAARQRRPM